MHTRDARAYGETEERLYLLDAWRKSPLYTPKERAALAWTEALTLVSETHAPDDVYAEVREYFDEAEIVKLESAYRHHKRLEPGRDRLPFPASGQGREGHRVTSLNQRRNAMTYLSKGFPKGFSRGRILAGLMIGAVSVGAATGAVLIATADGDPVRQIFSVPLPNVPRQVPERRPGELRAGRNSPSHNHHSASVFAFIVSGAIRSENSATGPAKVYKAGKSFFEPPGSIHSISENASTTRGPLRFWRSSWPMTAPSRLNSTNNSRGS